MCWKRLQEALEARTKNNCSDLKIHRPPVTNYTAPNFAPKLCKTNYSYTFTSHKMLLSALAQDAIHVKYRDTSTPHQCEKAEERTKQAIHYTAYRLLGPRPPKINLNDETLQRFTRSCLSQLRWGHCRARLDDTYPKCPYLWCLCCSPWHPECPYPWCLCCSSHHLHHNQFLNYVLVNNPEPKF